MCKGLSAIPSSCLEKAKGMRVMLTHLTEKPHKHRAQEEKTVHDLESLLNSKSGLQAFRWFLRSEFSEENLAFWLACQDYRSSPESRLAEKASSIYTQFINPDAPQEVNLDSETRDALMCVMDEPATNMFDEAQQRIYCLMAKDSFPRFLRSPYCRSTLRAL
ncbi:hypothetical protein SRHO_G00180960 [Serrasalmus rhombeus]|uniref:Si:ch211-196h16.12 n=1 Tax=Pygocentrus nattereri TaxID=42514 RepID=A0AAR2L8S3_PYGNA|nr:regulator of G-protein signaling 5 isoform X2 [Pygocentrus nattereri]